MGDGEALLAYHERTKHSAWRLRTTRHFLDFDNQPIPFKIYRDLEPIPLPRIRPPLGVPALRAILASAPGSRPPSGPERTPNLTSLSRVLHCSAGITKTKRFPGGEVHFRAHPNTGALYHVDLYLVCGELPDLAAGVYHFGPHDFSLRRLRKGDHRAALVEASGGEPSTAGAPVLLVSASTYWRNAWKYQARTYRHCFWDAGTLHANLLAVAAAEQLEPRILLGFAERPVEQLLGLDPHREGALTLVPLGAGAAPPLAAPPAPELHLETEPLSTSEVDYPEIRAAHAASSLESGAAASAWREARAELKLPPARGRKFALRPRPEADLPTESLESVIQRRGSTRVFDPERALPAVALATALDATTRGVPADFLGPAAPTLIELYLIVHHVEGIPPGAYYYRREERALELLREGSFRREAGRMGLFQELPAEAAVNVYCLTDLDAVLSAFGDRGYRAAQLEGGLLGGRLYLSAYAQRVGATGLTFLDDEVTEFFSPHAAGKSAMFLVALGHALRRQEAA